MDNFWLKWGGGRESAASSLGYPPRVAPALVACGALVATLWQAIPAARAAETFVAPGERAPPRLISRAPRARGGLRAGSSGLVEVEATSQPPPTRREVATAALGSSGAGGSAALLAVVGGLVTVANARRQVRAAAGRRSPAVTVAVAAAAPSRHSAAAMALAAPLAPQLRPQTFPGALGKQAAAPPRSGAVLRRAVADPVALEQLAEQLRLLVADPAATASADAPAAEAAAQLSRQLLELFGPPLPAEAAADVSAQASSLWSSVSNFFFDPRLQWDEKGNILLDPKGDPLPDNLWTQFVAVQATLIKRLNEGIHALGIPQSFGLAVCMYTLLIRTALYPFVKGQLETTAKIQVLAPRVNELKAKYKDNEERLQQEVGLLYMDLQIDPLGAILPLLLQLPVFWGLYRAIRRLAIVEYPPLRDGFLWIPSLYGPNFQPDPGFTWLTNWKGPLISLHPTTMSWEDFALFSVLPIAIFTSYKTVLSEATDDENSPKILQAFPFMLAFITCELPQAMGLYIATNIASSVALTKYTKDQISSKIPGYDEFVKTGKWPPGVDPEKVLAKAFGVKRLTGDDSDFEEPVSVPEAVFAGRADAIPALMEKGSSIDEPDDRGIPATCYTLALNNPDLLERLFELGADPLVLDKRGNSLLHYMAGYGRSDFLPMLLDKGITSLLDHTNEDGQTALDVARTNLSQEKVADDVRKVITLLNEQGAQGKTTTQEDEARFEEARERKKREETVNAARSALMALAAQAPSAADTTASAEAAEDAAEAGPSAVDAAAPAEGQAQVSAPGIIVDSLDRVKALDIEELKQRLGNKLSEEQLRKVSERLQAMSPEELSAYIVGLPSVKAQAQEAVAHDAVAPEAVAAAEEGAPEKEKRRQSVIVD